MTADDEDPQPAFAPVTLPETGTGERSRRRAQAAKHHEPAPGRAGPARGARVRTVAFALAYVALLAAVPVLIYVGYDKVLNTTSGRVVNPIDDPAEAGYEANVAPTPVELVAEVGPDGALVGGVVLSLTSGSTGGALVFLPSGTVVPAPIGGTLGTAYATGQLAGFRRAAAVLLNNGFDGVAAIDSARWAELVTPVAPIAITNPDKLPASTTGPAFAAGPLQLAPTEVGPYMAARKPNESDLNRLARQQLVWDAWLAAVGASTSPARIPGETATGLGHFIEALASGVRVDRSLPGKPITDGSIVDGFNADPAAVATMMATVVPYPTSDQPGDRIRVRVLDGVQAPGLTAAAAKLLVPAGAEVVIIGNATSFDHATTEVQAVGDTSGPKAVTMQQALGLGTVGTSEVLDDVVDVTIVLGADFAAKVGLTPTTTTLAPASSGGTGG